MFNNSFEVDITTIPEYLFKAIPLFSKLNINYFEEDNSTHDQKLNRRDKDFNWVRPIENLKEEIEKNIKNNDKKVKMINIPSLIGFFWANEDKLKQIFKIAALLKTKNKKFKKQFKNLMIRRENKSISRFKSWIFSSTYAAIENSFKT